MMNFFKKEYFNDYCYFLIEENNNDIVLNYSVYNTISESNNTKLKKRFKKEDLKKVENKVKKIVKSNKKVTKQEIDELVDEDGTFLTSRIPILNKWLTPKKITSVTVMQSRISNDPVTRGYRVYYGEGKEEIDDVINEINMNDAFAYKDTKFKDFEGTMKTLKKLGIKDPEERLERTKQLGKIRGQKVRKTKDGKKVLKQRIVEKEKLDEIKKEKMIKMVEDILTKKGENKEGISLNKLINILKQGE
jgi:hypothetical protein